MANRAGVKLENLNFNYLRKAIEKEGYSTREVSEAIGWSAGHLNRCFRNKYLYEDDLKKIRELVPLEEGRLMTVEDDPKEEPEKEVMVSIDEAVKMSEELMKDRDEEEDIRKELSEIREIVERIELAMVRGGFMRKGHDELARDILRKMLDRGRCTKAEFVGELAKCTIPPVHADNAIKSLGVIEAVHRDGRESTTWLIRE